MRITPFAAFATLLSIVGCSWAVPSETSIASATPSIVWRRWEAATFAEAKRAGRPLLVGASLTSLRVDLVGLVLVTGLVAAMIRSGRTITRREGGTALTLYLAFMLVTLAGG